MPVKRSWIQPRFGTVSKPLNPFTLLRAKKLMFLTQMSIRKMPSLKRLWDEVAIYVHPRYSSEIHFSLGLTRRYTTRFQRHECCVPRTREDGGLLTKLSVYETIVSSVPLEYQKFYDKKSPPHRLTLLNLKTVGIHYED